MVTLIKSTTNAMKEMMALIKMTTRIWEIQSMQRMKKREKMG
jgi:hypothetical protein